MKVCRICQKCNKEFDNEFSFCPFCGEKYISNKITTQKVVNNTTPKIPVSEAPKFKTCLSCRKNVPQADKYCQFCGAEFLSLKQKNQESGNTPFYKKNSFAVSFALIIFLALLTYGTIIQNKTNEENEQKIELLVEELKEDGWICITEGYTFDKCAEVARTYLNYNYDEEFYDHHVVVTTKDLKIYYLSGFTKSGKAIDVCIGHSAPDWYIIDASVYKKD